MYRLPSPRRRDRVVHGPFPIRPWRLLATAAGLFVAAVFAFLGLQSQALVCRRGDAVVCRADGFLAPDVSLPGTTLRAVRIETQRRGKGKGIEYGTVVLESERGSAKVLELSGDDARALAARIEAWKDGGGPELHERVHGPRWLLALAFGALIAAASLLRSALRGMGRVVLEIDGTRVDARRRVLGVAAGSWSSSLEGTEDVTIEWSAEPDFWLARSQVPRRLGRLVVVARGGDRRALTPRSWPGETLHLRAASELRGVLRLRRLAGGVEDQLAAVEAAPRRPAWADKLSSRIALCWAGACCGSLLGMALFGVVGIALGAIHLNESLPGWVPGGGATMGAVAGIAFVLWLARPAVPR